MAGSVNKVILVGNLGQDPEVRRLSSGDPVVNLQARDVGKLARQDFRRAQGADRVALGGHLQREPREGRRAISEEGREGLHRRPAADAAMGGSVRPEALHDGGGAAAVSGRAADARQPWRRRRRDTPSATGAAPSSAPPALWRGMAAAPASPCARRWTTRSRSRDGCRHSGSARRSVKSSLPAIGCQQQLDQIVVTLAVESAESLLCGRYANRPCSDVRRAGDRLPAHSGRHRRAPAVCGQASPWLSRPHRRAMRSTGERQSGHIRRHDAASGSSDGARRIARPVGDARKIERNRCLLQRPGEKRRRRLVGAGADQNSRAEAEQQRMQAFGEICLRGGPAGLPPDIREHGNDHAVADSDQHPDGRGCDRAPISHSQYAARAPEAPSRLD